MNAPLPQNVTLPESAPALPERWIDKLFGEMATMYGSKFADLWRGTDPKSVKAKWAEKLAGFADKPGCIRSALDALDDHVFPPTLPEFLGMCREAARRMGTTTPAMLEHKQTPEDIERAKQFAKSLKRAIDTRDHMGWIKRPKSQAAFSIAIEEAKRNPVVRSVIDECKAKGVCDENGRLLKRWDGMQWVQCAA